jgi:hypothetical protein
MQAAQWIVGKDICTSRVPSGAVLTTGPLRLGSGGQAGQTAT